MTSTFASAAPWTTAGAAVEAALSIQQTRAELGLGIDLSTIVLKLLKEEGRELSRDVIFAAVADEENGCTWGSEWLVAWTNMSPGGADVVAKRVSTSGVVTDPMIQISYGELEKKFGRKA